MVREETETAVEEGMRGFTLILWSILLEALPFVLLGTVISSLIQVFVSEDMILKIMPKTSFYNCCFRRCRADIPRLRVRDHPHYQGAS